MRKQAIAFAIFQCCFFALSCKETPPGPPTPSTIQLAFEDASCTEAWLKVSLADANEPRTVAVKRDGQTVLTARLSANDTTLVDTSLLPKRNYTYQAIRLNNNSPVDTSPTLQMTTMDTTSHNYTWIADTIGDGNASVLFDVAIISENNVWAVGIFYFSYTDSTGFHYRPYNLAQWNGTRWNYQQVYFATCDQNGNEIGIGIDWVNSIQVFGANDIWLASGGGFVHWNGTQFVRVCRRGDVIQGEILKLWGTSSSNIYGVGRNGTLIRFDGTSWQKIPSGTDIDLQDICGNPGGSIIWACGYSLDYSRSILMQKNGQQWRRVVEVPITTPLRPDTLSGSLASLWTSSSNSVEVATSGGMYRISSQSHGEGKRTWNPDPSSLGFFNRVRGTSRNNIFVVGDFATIAHFNGVGWHLYDEFISTSHPLKSIAVSGNKIFAVGRAGIRGIVYRGQQ